MSTLSIPENFSIPQTVKTCGFVKDKFENPTELPLNSFVGIRLNLNVLKATGVALQTIHLGNAQGWIDEKGFFDKPAVDYRMAVYLKNAQFSINQNARELIFTGQSNKFPMASVDGQIQQDPTPDNLNGLLVGFNPKREHLFVDQDGYAIKCAEHAIVYGHKVWVWGHVEYYTHENMPQATSPSAAKFKEHPYAFVEQHHGQPASIQLLNNESIMPWVDLKIKSLNQRKKIKL